MVNDVVVRKHLFPLFALVFACHTVIVECANASAVAAQRGRGVTVLASSRGGITGKTEEKIAEVLAAMGEVERQLQGLNTSIQRFRTMRDEELNSLSVSDRKQILHAYRRAQNLNVTLQALRQRYDVLISASG